jgi:hypothetical protein
MDRSVIYDVQDAKVYPLTADATGGPTYGAAIDVPGISQVTVSPQYENAQLVGDGREIDTRTRLMAAELSFRYGKLDPEVLAALDGGTAVSAVGPPVSTSYHREGDDRIPYFGFAAQVVEVDEADGVALLAVYKARITDGSLFQAESNTYGQPEFTARAVYTEGGVLWTAELISADTALPADLADLLPA